MKTILSLAACVAMASLGACNTLGSGQGGTDLVGAVKEIASDPNCGHTDRVSGNLGGLGGNNLNVYLERSCPSPVAAPVSTPDLQKMIREAMAPAVDAAVKAALEEYTAPPK
ncbi:MAG: hypothetical protein GC203_02705 [Phenylobacterium sp.]|uniref:hypothetical protein n=1 Tax=Phenylobacterium sp. TaxID=1871053 RepID=UPI0025F55FFE|nr:hypothetical protein [Phenylobacterium sp.]MBI1196751.1 hypothetical protein [Phenylobacterium sp.]